MTSFKHKLYYLIEQQLPEHVRLEYPVFVDFLKAYYKFLDESDQANSIILNSDTWSDIDLTLDLFLPEFRKQFAYDIPATATLNIRRLLKYINEFYEAKGSENATDIFFQFMYGDKGEVEYPGDYILRASDGRWSQKKIIKVDTQAFTQNNIFELKNQVITLSYYERLDNEGLVPYNITTSCFDVVAQTQANIYQLEVDIDPNYQFPEIIAQNPSYDSLGNYDTYVYIKFGEKTYGSISKQIVDVISIDDPGSKFKLKDTYVVTEQGIEAKYFAQVYVETTSQYVFDSFTNQALVNVKKVSTTGVTGELYRLELITTGQRFLARTPVTVSGGVAYFSQTYTVSNIDYATDAANLVPIDTFTVEIPPKDTTGQEATVTFRTGLIYKDVGFFKDSSGFVSDVNKLQDNYYYQPYSYVVRTQTPLSIWNSAYLRSNHPAGFKMFAELQFIDTIDERQYLTASDNFTFVDLQLIDSITISEVIGFQFNYTLADTIVTVDTMSKAIMPTLSAQIITVTDSLASSVQLVKSESIALDEIVSKGVSGATTYLDSSIVSDSAVFSINPAQSDIIGTSETVLINPNKALSDTVITTDNISFNTGFGVSLSDTIITSEELDIVSGTTFRETNGISDTLSVSYSTPQSDTIATSDVSTLSVGNNKTDTITTSDVLLVTSGPGISDTIITSDPIRFNTSSVLLDSASVTDTPVLNVNKISTDIISVADSAPIFTLSNALNDTSAVSDSPAINFAKGNIIDEISQSDNNLAVSVSKPISESISTFDIPTINFNSNSIPNESITLSDSISSALTRMVTVSDSIASSDSAPIINANTVYTDSSIVSDVTNINTSTVRTDTVVTSESRSSYLEGYAEGTTPTGYFSEYYVGSLSTF